MYLKLFTVDAIVLCMYAYCNSYDLVAEDMPCMCEASDSMKIQNTYHTLFLRIRHTYIHSVLFYLGSHINDQGLLLPLF